MKKILLSIAVLVAGVMNADAQKFADVTISDFKAQKDGDKVKVSIRFRGRQIAHSDIGLKIMQDFAERITEYGTIERRPMLEGRHMIMILAPKAEKKSFAEKSQQRKEKSAAKVAEQTEEAVKKEPKPQPKKKVKRESENMI